MFICGLVKSKSLIKFNQILGNHYEALFDKANGNQLKMKYSAACPITVGYKYYFRRFIIGNDKILQLDKNSICTNLIKHP
jgi:hypothetical protein